jgi:hypothetical protein
MFESLEIRRAANGFILVINDDSGDTKELVYDTERKLLRALKPLMGEKVAAE